MPATSTEPAPERPSAPRARRWAAVLAVSAAWAIAVPYLAAALGVRLDVAGSVEVVDHVVPGVVVLAAALALVAAPAGAPPAAPGDLRWSVAAAAGSLAGFWIVATHVPLLVEAIDGITPWDAAALHLTAGLPVLTAGGWMLVAPLVGRSRLRPWA